MCPTVPNASGKRQVRFPGINADARILGVNRNTIYRMLTGEYAHLKTLRKRYDTLKAQQSEGRK